MRTLQASCRVALSVPNASGVAAIDAQSLLVVDDDLGVYCADPKGRAVRLKSRQTHRALDDLEGICLDHCRQRVLTLSEKKGEVSEIPFAQNGGAWKLGELSSMGRLARVGKTENKGWEGIAWVPPGHFAQSDVLVAVHEGKPRRVGIFALPGLETLAMLKLSKVLKKRLDDLSDVEFLRQKGTLLLLSDESACLVEVGLHKLDGQWHLKMISEHKLDVGKNEKPEGLSVGPDGTLWLVTDGDPHLYRYDW